MKKVLITPLDWGLGHATRCIPIIRELLKRECEVLIAGSGDSLTLLKNEFPDLTFFTLSPYAPAYSKTQTMILKILSQVPKFIRTIRREHRQIETLVTLHKIDLIISDNRYGCWSSKAPSVCITHQLNILMPAGIRWIQPVMARLHKRLLKRFSYCWVPDYAENERRLSGKLCDSDQGNFDHVRYIGPLSRFRATENGENKYDLICVLSGPEPQRSIFEDTVRKQLQSSGLRYLVIRGVLSGVDSKPEDEEAFLNTEGLQRVMGQSSMVIARSGYSTIMDLAALKKKGILIPTPGQTEQEYLADRWKQKGAYYSVSQQDFELHEVLEQSKKYKGLEINPNDSRELLGRALDALLT